MCVWGGGGGGILKSYPQGERVGYAGLTARGCHKENLVCHQLQFNQIQSEILTFTRKTGMKSCMPRCRTPRTTGNCKMGLHSCQE